MGLGLAFGAAVFKGLKSVYMKKNALDTDEYVTAWSMRFFSIPFLGFAAAFSGIPELNTAFVGAVFSTSVLLTFASVLLAKAHKLSDISLIMPVMAFSPALLLITSPIMVNQVPSIEGVIGVLLVTLGAFYLKSEGKRSLKAPFKGLFKDRGVQLISIVVFIYSITANLDKIGVDNSSPVFWALATNLVTTMLLTPVMYKKSEGWRKSVKDYWKPLTILGALGGFTVILQFTALEKTIVPYVISVKRLSIPITVILGYFTFKEKNVLRRLIGSLVMVTGAIIIYLAL